MRVCVLVGLPMVCAGAAYGGTVTIEPDDFAENQVIAGFSGITFQGKTQIFGLGSVYAQTADTGFVSTGTKVFDFALGGTGAGVWRGATANLLDDWNTNSLVNLVRVDFDDPAEFTEASIDFIGDTVDPTRNIGRIQAFDVGGNLVADFVTGPLAQFEVGTGTVTHAPGISFIIIGSSGLGNDVGLDNLVLTGGGEVIPLPSAAGLAGIGLLGLGVRRRR